VGLGVHPYKLSSSMAAVWVGRSHRDPRTVVARLATRTDSKRIVKTMMDNVEIFFGRLISWKGLESSNAKEEKCLQERNQGTPIFLDGNAEHLMPDHTEYKTGKFPMD